MKLGFRGYDFFVLIFLKMNDLKKRVLFHLFQGRRVGFLRGCLSVDKNVTTFWIKRNYILDKT